MSFLLGLIIGLIVGFCLSMLAAAIYVAGQEVKNR